MLTDRDTKIVLEINNERFTRWQSYDIESDLLQPADAFSFKAPNLHGEMAQKIHRGDFVSVLLDDTVQMRGIVDDVSYSGDADSGFFVDIRGRDLFGQLIDCSAPLLHLKNPTLKTIAETLGGPWIGEWAVDNEDNKQALIAKAEYKRNQASWRKQKEGTALEIRREVADRYRVTSDNKTELLAEMDEKLAQIDGDLDAATRNLNQIRAKLFPNLKVEPGQTAMEILEQRAQKALMLIWCAANGAGIIGKPAYSLDPIYRLRLYPSTDGRCGENNIKAASVHESMQNVYSEYVCYGNAGNTKVKYGTGNNYKGIARDDTIPIPRTLILTDGDIKNVQQAKEKAEAERDRRRFESISLDYTVPGHYNEGFGSEALPWQIDTLVDVDDQISGYKGVYYVTRRRFSGDESGRWTEITLHESGVWLA